MSNFIEKCINGDALMSEINDYIDAWHNSDSKLSLNEYLGMSKKEYALFVEYDIYLAYIITAHKDKVPIEEIIASQTSLAARADTHEKSRRLERWLKNEGLWD